MKNSQALLLLVMLAILCIGKAEDDKKHYDTQFPNFKFCVNDCEYAFPVVIEDFADWDYNEDELRNLMVKPREKETLSMRMDSLQIVLMFNNNTKRCLSAMECTITGIGIWASDDADKPFTLSNGVRSGMYEEELLKIIDADEFDTYGSERRYIEYAYYSDGTLAQSINYYLRDGEVEHVLYFSYSK